MSNENKQKVPAKETPEIKLTNLKTEITWIIIGCFVICLTVKFLLPLAPNMLEANYFKSDVFSNMYAVNGKWNWFLVNQQNKGLFKRRQLYDNFNFIRCDNLDFINKSQLY